MALTVVIEWLTIVCMWKARHIFKTRRLSEKSTELWATSDDFRARAKEQFRCDALSEFDSRDSKTGTVEVTVVDCKGAELDRFTVWWGEGVS